MLRAPTRLQSSADARSEEKVLGILNSICNQSSVSVVLLEAVYHTRFKNINSAPKRFYSTNRQCRGGTGIAHRHFLMENDACARWYHWP